MSQLERIIVFTPSVFPEPGGLQRYSYLLAESLAMAGHRVALISLDHCQEFVSPHTNLTYHWIGRWGTVEHGLVAKLYQKVYLVRALSRFCREDQATRLICTWWDPLGYLALWVSWWRGVPLVTIAHGQEVIRLPENFLPRLVKKQLRKSVFRNSENVIAVSNFTREKVLELGVPPQRVKVVPNGLSPAYLAQALLYDQQSSKTAIGQQGPIVLQVGRLVPRKGHAFVFEVLKLLETRISEPITYLVIGSGPHREYLEAQAHQLGLDERVIFTGYVPDERLHIYYAAADVVIMPAHNQADAGDVEGFGIVYLEAYAHGKPVIGFRSGGVPDVVVDGETGYLLEPDDRATCAARLAELLTQPEKAHRLGETGRTLVHQRWNWQVLAQDILESS